MRSKDAFSRKGAIRARETEGQGKGRGRSQRGLFILGQSWSWTGLDGSRPDKMANFIDARASEWVIPLINAPVAERVISARPAANSSRLDV